MHASLCIHEHIAATGIHGWGILHKESFVCSPWCSIHRRIDKENSEASAKLYKCAANCLDKAAETISIMRMICLSSHVNVTFLVPLSGFLVVWSLLPNSHYSPIVMLHTSCYCTKGKFFFPKTDDSPPFKSISCWNAIIFRWKDIVTPRPGMRFLLFCTTVYS